MCGVANPESFRHRNFVIVLRTRHPHGPTHDHVLDRATGSKPVTLRIVGFGRGVTAQFANPLVTPEHNAATRWNSTGLGKVASMSVPAAPADPTAPILVLNGPNLNMLGMRQPEVYGPETLDDVVELCRTTAARHGREITAYQSNSEGALIDRIHRARGAESAIVINPGGLTHTSVALRDALVIPEIPIVEVHISNVHAREQFRQHSYISPIASAVIAGMGSYGYAAAIEYLLRDLPARD